MLSELRQLLSDRFAGVRALLSDLPDSLKEFEEQWRMTGEVSEVVEQQVSDWMQGRISQFQNVDRHYWREIIRELKILRGEGRLVLEGSPV